MGVANRANRAIAAGLLALPVEAFMIDSEAVVEREDGLHDFHALRGAVRGAPRSSHST